MMNKEDYAKLGITKKNKISQMICKHNNREWFREATISISGEPRIFICKDCGKELSRFFAHYEGNGFK